MIINSQSSLQVGWSASAADIDTDRSDVDDNGVRADLPLEIFFSFGNCLKKGGEALPVVVNIMMVTMIMKLILAISIMSQRWLEVGLSAIAAADDTDRSDDDVVGCSSHHYHHLPKNVGGWLECYCYNAGWTPRGVVLFANNIWVEVKRK